MSIDQATEMDQRQESITGEEIVVLQGGYGGSSYHRRREGKGGSLRRRLWGRKASTGASEEGEAGKKERMKKRGRRTRHGRHKDREREALQRLVRHSRSRPRSVKRL